MAYKIEELCPNKPFIEFDECILYFNHITLRIMGILSEKYESLYKASEIIIHKPEEIYNIGFILLADKSEIKSSSRFKKFVNNQNLGTAELASELTRVFHKAITESNPLQKNKKLMDDYHRAMGSDSKDPCYANYFDTVAKRYGFNIESFLDLTLRQLYILLTASEDGKREELEVSAALAGKQLKPQNKPLDIDEKTDADQDAEARELLKRLQENPRDEKYYQNEGKIDG